MKIKIKPILLYFNEEIISYLIDLFKMDNNSIDKSDNKNKIDFYLEIETFNIELFKGFITILEKININNENNELMLIISKVISKFHEDLILKVENINVNIKETKKMAAQILVFFLK